MSARNQPSKPNKSLKRRIVRSFRRVHPRLTHAGLLRMFNGVTSVVTNPEFLFTFAIIFFLSHTTFTSKESSIIGKIIKRMIDDKNTAPFGCFCYTHIAQFFGLLAFIPALVNSSHRNRPYVVFFAFLFVYLLPNRTNYTAVIQGMLTFIFVKVKSHKVRCLIFVSMIISYSVQTGVKFDKVEFPTFQEACKDVPQMFSDDSEVAQATPESAQAKDSANVAGICIHAGTLNFLINPDDKRCRIDFNTGTKWKSYYKACTTELDLAYFPSFRNDSGCLNGFKLQQHLKLDENFLNYVTV